MSTCVRGPRTIVAASEADLAKVFDGVDGVESIETGREDGTGNWASDRLADQYEGHAYVKVNLHDDVSPNEADRVATEAGLSVHGIGHHHIRACEGREIPPENRRGMEAWDSIRVGDRFTAGGSVEHEALSVEPDPENPDRVSSVTAIPTFYLDKDSYDVDRDDSSYHKTFETETFNRVRHIRNHSPYGTTDCRITKMNGEFVIPDDD